MALDPSIQPLVDLVNAAAAEAPPLAEQTVAERRINYHKLVAAAGPGPELADVSDSLADGVPIRVYKPNADGGTGIAVYYHGGGWVIGDLDSHDEVCRQLAAQSGAVVVSVGYRLAPEAVFPAAVDDSWTALQWVDANRGLLTGDDAAAVVVSGDSAGGNLAAVVALMARDAGLDLAAQLLVYPSVDMLGDFPSLAENGEGFVLTAETMEWFRGHYLASEADADDWRASPLSAPSFENVAPALIITASYDPLRDQGPAYAAALEAAGVDVTLTNYEGMVHIFFQLGPIVPKGAEAVSQVAEAIRSACS